MSEIVFILGAGASVDAGAPLMKEFLARARAVLPHHPQVALIKKAAGKLQSVLAKSAFDIRNIESIFGAIEMGRLIKRFPGFQEDELPALSVAINHIIAATLNETVKCKVADGQIHPNKVYAHFCYLLEALRDQRRTVSVITFNYDVALDYAMQFGNIRSEYYLDGDQTSGVPLLKLHGSLNWGTCPRCKSIVATKPLFKLHEHMPFARESSLELGFNIDKEFQGMICKDPACGNEKIDPSPVLVPPIWNKTTHHEQLGNVWRQAAKELSEAQEIIICGYSMPESDAFFTYLFALGSVGDEILNRVTVYDPDPHIEERFRRLTGTAVSMTHHKALFSEALGFIQIDLKIPSPK
jgi:NAD-dependent SIR2 family protein deacetylase